MSEDGCLRDAVFNTFQVISGTVEDAFPGGKGIMKGLTVENDYDISMGNNRVEDVALPTEETDAASKYYVDSIFPARFIDWVSDGPPQNIGENTSPQFVNLILTGGLKIEGSTQNAVRTNLNAIDPDQERFINLANADGTLIPFDLPSTTTISATPEELNLLSGTILGTASANDILSVDSNRNITGLHDLTIDGTFTNGTLTIDGGNVTGVNSVTVNTFTFEGSTIDDFETNLGVIDPTEDRTINLANSSGTLIPFSQPSTTTISATPEELNLLSGTVLGTATANDILSVDSNRDISGLRNVNVETLSDGTITITGGNITNVSSLYPQNVVFEGTTDDSFETTFSVIDPTEDRTINLANSSGTLVPFSQPSTTTISATPEELNLLSGTVLGNASANDILSVDSNRDISGIRNVNVETLSDGTISITGGNITNVSSLYPQNVVFEGTTDDSFQTTFSVIDPTEDRTINLADSSGTLVPFSQPSTTTISATPEELNLLSGTVLGNVSANDILSVDSNRNISGLHDLTIDGTFTNGAFTFDGSGVFSTNILDTNSIRFEGSIDDEYETLLDVNNPTADRTINLADCSGTLVPFSNPYSSPINVSPTEINHLDNIESNIQEQLDSKMDDFIITKIRRDLVSSYTYNYNNFT